MTRKQRKYVEHRAKGKNKLDAGLAAGYSLNTAVAAKTHIETPAVRQAFADLIRRTIPMEKVAQRISEGLDAQKTEFAKFEGKITDETDTVDFEQRRKYAELVATYGEYHVDKQEIDVRVQHEDGATLDAMLGSVEDKEESVR